jgi:hypothetical protein
VPFVIFAKDDIVTRCPVGEINDVSLDDGTAHNRKVLPIRKPYVEEQMSVLIPMRNPVHLLAVNLRVPSAQFFMFLLDSLIQTPVLRCANRGDRSAAHPDSVSFFTHGFIPSFFMGLVAADPRLQRAIYFIDDFADSKAILH